MVGRTEERKDRGWHLGGPCLGGNGISLLMVVAGHSTKELIVLDVLLVLLPLVIKRVLLDRFERWVR